MIKPWEDGRQVGECCICGNEIFEGDAVCIDESGEMICEECLENMSLKDYLLDHLNLEITSAEMPEREYDDAI